MRELLARYWWHIGLFLYALFAITLAYAILRPKGPRLP